MLTEEVKGIEISSFPPHPSVKDAHLPLEGEGFSYLVLQKKFCLQAESTLSGAFLFHSRLRLKAILQSHNSIDNILIVNINAEIACSYKLEFVLAVSICHCRFKLCALHNLE